MYPHRTQLQTRRQERERELQAIRQSDRAGRHTTVPRPHTGPARYKLALLTWAGAYALITLILALLGPMMGSWPLALRTLVLSVTIGRGADVVRDAPAHERLPRLAGTERLTGFEPAPR